jgi:hypothetical protein
MNNEQLFAVRHHSRENVKHLLFLALNITKYPAACLLQMQSILRKAHAVGAGNERSSAKAKAKAPTNTLPVKQPNFASFSRTSRPSRQMQESTGLLIHLPLPEAAVNNK